MLPPSFQRLRRKPTGSTLVMVAVFIVALFAFASLSIDVANVFNEQRRVQFGADAAALAGVVLLTNSPPAASAAVTEATAIANANGVTAAEIANSSIGAIQVGNWNANTLTFTAGATPLNAVSVPARRTVPLSFGKIIGMSQMTPAIQSIAWVSAASSAYGGGTNGLIPFAVHPAQATNAFYVPYTFNKGDIGSGNFGKLNLTNPTDPSATWSDNMIGGCNCTLTTNLLYADVPGNAGISDAFATRFAANPYIIMPVFDDNGPGNSAHGDVITGFVAAKILAVNGNGNWTITLENIPLFIGGGGGGAGDTNYQAGITRNLVK